ncbi:MAG: choice-of-anchor D domain-containing protein [bacterium]|nr:choice-of-anchor D domain-containing protein [Candidatus Kapabacteria bacterium]
MALQFTPTVPGIAIAHIIIRSNALPLYDTLVLKGRGDIPLLMSGGAPIAPDTICPGERYDASIPVSNPTACDVIITSVTSDDAQFVVDLPQGVVLPAFSSRRLLVSGMFANTGTYPARITIASNGGPDATVDLKIVVASRELLAAPSLVFGDVRIGVTSGPQRITIVASGTAETVIQRLRIAGANATEYSFVLPNGETLPHRMQSGERLEVDVTFAPSDLESRRAIFIVEPAVRGACNVPDPLELNGRGVMPVIDAPRRIVQLGSICAGLSYDTTIALRNLGNAPLSISAVETINATGRATLVTNGLPAIIEPDSTRVVTISIQPDALGPFNLPLRFISDGTWFTAPDTTVKISGTAVLCASVWIDTIYANVGDRISIPVRFDASPVTGATVATLLNDLGAQPITFSIAHDGKVMRFIATPPTDGMLSPLGASVQVTPSGIGVRVDAPVANGLSASPLLASLAADVLLGDKDRTVLALAIENLAGGFTKLNINNGLLIPNYCALDQRLVDVNGLLLSATSSPITTSGSFVIYLPDPGHATLTLHDELGRIVATLLDDSIAEGARTVAVSSEITTSGVYTAMLRVGGRHVMQQVVIVR